MPPSFVAPSIPGLPPASIPGLPSRLPGANNIVGFQPIRPPGNLPTPGLPLVPGSPVVPSALLFPSPSDLSQPRQNPFFPLVGPAVFGPGEGLLNPAPAPTPQPQFTPVPFAPPAPNQYTIGNYRSTISPLDI